MTLKDFNGAEGLNFNCRFISILFAILPNVFPGKIYFENILIKVDKTLLYNVLVYDSTSVLKTLCANLMCAILVSYR